MSWGAEARSAIPAVDDAALLKLFEPVEIRLPPRLFTSEMVARLRESQPTILDGYVGFFGSVELGKRFAEQIPGARWREMIPPYAAFTARCGNNQNIRDSAVCPFCGKLYGGPLMTLEDFFQNPFRARTGCCGQFIYEREADMPADYKAKPNHTEKIPHLDGGVFEYRFYVPPGMENAGPELGAGRRNWFCSASEVWWARERYFQTEYPEGQSVLNALATAVFRDNHAKAARALAIIYDRLAEVYPGYPLVDNGGTSNGLARGADGKRYLMHEEYRATAVPRPWNRPAWFPLVPYYNLGKMNHASGWQDGVMSNAGNLAAIFDLIRDRPETRAYSAERYQNETAWEARVRKGVLDELHFIGQWSTPMHGGNTSYGWILGAVKLGLFTQDPYFVQTAVGMIGPVIDNHYFSDGLCTEGAFNYAAMIRPMVGMATLLRDNLGIDIISRHPQLPLIERRDDRPVTTLYGVESMHSDEHAHFFTGNGTGWKIPPEKPDYTKHEMAQCDPEYGLACLRAGKPGCRLETILDFQAAKQHTHDARLNVQMFYEGVNLMPDVGYACVAVDVTGPPWSQAQYPFEKLPLPPGTDFWGAWYYGFSVTPEIHCTALVDGEHSPPSEPGPVAFQRFLGGGKFEEPGYDAQFVEVDGRGLFHLRPQPIEVFRRQLVAVTLADGRPLALDFFRIRGGQRHDLLWHAPATGPDDKLETSLGPPVPLTGSLNDVLNQANPNRKEKPEPGTRSDLIRRLGRWAMPDKTWQTTFHVQPARFNPATEGGKKIYAPWMQALHDANLRLWGMATGTSVETREILCGRSPWPSKIWEVFDGKETKGTISLKDAFHIFVESRTSKTPGLSTTYLHVLEPFNPDQPPCVANVENVAPVEPDPSAMGAGIRVTLASGPEAVVPARTLLAATTHNAGRFTGGGMTLNGRLGVAQPADHRLTLFDGSQFSVGNFGVAIEPTWRMKLLGVVGDLTGHPGESALIVKSSRLLPTDRTLVGRMLTVRHQISPDHSSGYVIERVAAFGRGRYRIDLRNAPSFLVHRFSVAELDAKDPRKIKINYWMLKGDNERGPYDGRRVRLPRQKFEAAMSLGEGRDPWHHAWLVLATPPPERVQPGDPLIIYQIQPGDEVIVPSHFACKGTETPEGLKLELAATGPATLTIPGPYQKATLLLGVTQAPLSRVTGEPGSLRVELGREDLADGRTTLLLAK